MEIEIFKFRTFIHLLLIDDLDKRDLLVGETHLDSKGKIVFHTQFSFNPESEKDSIASFKVKSWKKGTKSKITYSVLES